MEGRLWALIFKHFPKENAYSCWTNFFEFSHEFGENDYFHTLHLASIPKEEVDSLSSLPPVFTFLDLMEIAYITNKSIKIIYFINLIDQPRIPIDYFELSLEFDEESACMLFEKTVDSTNFKIEYIKISILKKFFRLACKLSTIKQCKVYLNSKAPIKEYNFIFNHEVDRKYKHLKNNEIKEIKSIINNDNRNALFKKQVSMIKKSSFSKKIIESFENSEKEENMTLGLKKSMFDRPNSRFSLIEIPKTESNFILAKEKEITDLANRNLESKSNKTFGINEQSESIANIDFKQIRAQRLAKYSFNINIHLIITESLRYGKYAFYATCLMSLIERPNLQIEFCEKVCKSASILTNEKNEILKCRQPILTLILFAELLANLAAIFPRFNDKCITLKDSILELCSCIQSSIKDEEKLTYYLQKQFDQIGRNALEIIAKNKFFSLLSDTNTANIVTNLWYGAGNHIQLWRFSRNTRLLESSIEKQRYDDIIKPLDSETEKRNYSFQYCMFIHNCSVRFFIDGFLIILLTLLYQYIIFRYANIYITHIEDAKANYPDTYEQFLDENKVDPEDDAVLVFLKGLVMFFVSCICLKQVTNVVFFYKTNRNIEFSIYQLFDVILLGLTSFNYFRYIDLFLEKDTDIYKLADSTIYSGIILLLWIRVFSSLETNALLGPFVQVMKRLLKVVFDFMIVFACLNCLFSQIFSVILSKVNEDFDTLFKSWTYLFSVSLGEFKFLGTESNYEIRYILLMFYATVSNIILMNLVISIVENIYNINSFIAASHNKSVLITNYYRLKWDNKYGFLILLPAPLNILSSWLVIPVFFLSEELIERYNNKVSKMFYAIITAITFCFFFSYNMVSIPASTLKSLAQTAYWNAKINLKIVDHKNLTQGFRTVIMRPFEMLKYMFEDCKLYWKITYSDEVYEKKMETKMIQINSTDVQILRTAFLVFKLRDKKANVSASELMNQIGIRKRTESVYGKVEKQGDASDFNLGEERKSKSLIICSDIKVEKKLKFLIKKICNSDGFIDIDLALEIFINRSAFNEDFLVSMYYYGMNFLEKGINKYNFQANTENTFLSFKKVKNLIMKLDLKVGILLHQVNFEKGKINVEKLKEIQRKEYYDNDEVSEEEGSIVMEIKN